MIGSFFSRILLMIFGYAYPAYECYKTVETNKPDIEHLRFWCQYWILVALLTVSERFCDACISWLPMYCEAKLAFFVYLWCPKTKGTAYIYDTFFRPYVEKHEKEIDRNLLELKTRFGDVAVLCWQKAAEYAQTRFFEILQFVSSQSPLQQRKARTVQEQQQNNQPSPPSPAANNEPQDDPSSMANNAGSHPQTPSSVPSRLEAEAKQSDCVGSPSAKTNFSNSRPPRSNNTAAAVTKDASSHTNYRGKLRRQAPIASTH